MAMIPAVEIGNGVKYHGACIRISDTKNQEPYIHYNSAHACAGITGIEPQTDGRLRVFVERDPDGRSRPIISGFVNGDEAFAQNWGWRAGFTGGVGHADIVFAYEGNERACWHPQLHKPSQNLWVGFVTIDRDTKADLDLDAAAEESKYINVVNGLVQLAVSLDLESAAGRKELRNKLVTSLEDAEQLGRNE